MPGLHNGIKSVLFIYSGCHPFYSCSFCRVSCLRFATDLRWKAIFMVLGSESMVSFGTPFRYFCCYTPVMGRRDLPTNYLGNGTSFEGWRHRICWFIHILLAKKTIVLSGAGMGVYLLLYSIWFVGCGQLVLGMSTFF
jgi:hypothetical protein